MTHSSGKLFLSIEDEGYEEEAEKCKGLFFRGFSSIFWKEGNLESREGFRLLKRKSCPGCEHCYWYFEMTDNDVDCEAVSLPERIKHGALYSVDVTPGHEDWETGIIEDYDIIFIEVKEDES